MRRCKTIEQVKSSQVKLYLFNPKTYSKRTEIALNKIIFGLGDPHFGHIDDRCTQEPPRL